jgi:hypothetical protein
VKIVADDATFCRKFRRLLSTVKAVDEPERNRKMNAMDILTMILL